MTLTRGTGCWVFALGILRMYVKEAEHVQQRSLALEACSWADCRCMYQANRYSIQAAAHKGLSADD